MIPGIGKKTALRIAVELQEKLEIKERVIALPGSREKEDILSALINLGFKRKEVEKIVDETIRRLGVEAGLETLLKESLKHLAKV